MELSELLIYFSSGLVIIGISLYLYFAFYSNLFFKKDASITSEKASSFGEFINGLTGPIFALAGFLIIYGTIMDQNKVNNSQQFENNFYKVLDFHRSNNIDISIKSPRTCQPVTGRQVWVSFYSQIKHAYEVIESDSLFKEGLDHNEKLDIAFATLYFGRGSADTVRLYTYMEKLVPSEEKRADYLKKLKLVEHCDESSTYFVGFSNLLNSYYTEYFNYVKIVDDAKFLNFDEKARYINLLKIQKDNFGGIIQFYYIKSNLAKPSEVALVEKYNLLDNLDSILYIK